MKYAFEPFLLDGARRELLCDGRPVHLQPQVFDLLCLLVENAHRVVSRDEIVEKVWRGRIVSEDAISSRIRDLRRVLVDTSQDPNLIRTIRGHGFRFMGEVRLRASAQSERVEQEKKSGVEQAPFDLPVKEPPPSIAVLPFQRNGDMDRFEAIEEAIPRELIMTLASLRWIKVVSHGSAFRFRGRQIDLTEVNRILGARYCLTGVIDMNGNRITIDTELSDTRSSEVIWALRKSASMDDIHALRAEIAANVIMVAELEIPQHETLSIGPVSAENLDAWSSMHLGFHYMSQFSQSGNAIAEKMLSRALSLDPRLARACAGMAFVHFQNAFMRYRSDFAAEAETARRYAEQSLTLQPRDPFASFIMGRCHWLDHDPEGSKQWFAQSVASCPNYTWGYYGSSWANVFTDDFETALDQANRAIDLSPIDPFKPGMTGNKMWVHIAHGDLNSAVYWAETAARTPWSHAGMAFFAAMSNWLKGDNKKADWWITEARRRNPELSKAHVLALVPASSTRFRSILDDATVALNL
ncbi:winged helix-turn-helix domain-containing protein [Ruegeria sp. ANG-R]|uniref:winged helix-turn-helix domain-containing protein n=1 Tax=Ruegeria sp. ANG-R TaxID=1577903 RepID=UPI00068BA650|nr:winged helix-turn-helix domain-containing protein [Ruegeria sp. ANG-R]